MTTIFLRSFSEFDPCVTFGRDLAEAGRIESFFLFDSLSKCQSVYVLSRRTRDKQGRHAFFVYFNVSLALLSASRVTTWTVDFLTLVCLLGICSSRIERLFRNCLLEEVCMYVVLLSIQSFRGSFPRPSSIRFLRKIRYCDGCHVPASPCATYLKAIVDTWSFFWQFSEL